jgi:hypothetical protein
MSFYSGIRALSSEGSSESGFADSRTSKSMRPDADVLALFMDDLAWSASDVASVKKEKLTVTMNQECEGRSLQCQKRKEAVARHQFLEAFNTEHSGGIRGIVITQEYSLVALAAFKLQDINEYPVIN